MTVVDYLEDTRTPFVVTLHDYWYVCANAQLLTNTDQKICSGPNTRFTNCAACALARAGWSKWEWLAPALAPLLYYRDRRLHKILDLAQSIIVPTNFVYNTFAEMGAPVKKIRTIRHGLDLPRDSVHKVRKMRDMRGFRPPLHIGYIGGINWQKGIHVLIDAVNRLPVDQVKLTIYGNLSSFPDYVSELRRRCHHPNILLAGPVSREQIWTALASFDVLVLPTLWFETSSLVLDEAFAVKVPVVASRIGVMIEKIKDNINGRLFPVGDIDALTRLLSDLINQPDVLQQWQEGIPEVYRIEEHVRDIEKVYQEAVDAV